MKICWKKISAAVVAFFGIGTLTACYGAPPQIDEDNPFTVNGQVSTVDENGETLFVSNVRVLLNTGTKTYSAKTNQQGYYELNVADLPDSYSLIFQDSNGVLKTDTADIVNTTKDFVQTCDITLKKQVAE